MADRRFVLAHDVARRGAAAYIADEAPDGWVVVVSEPRRGKDINAALHAKLRELSMSRLWIGKKWDAEVWKRLLVAAWNRATGEPIVILPALDGAGVDIVFRRTSSMTQREVSDLMQFIEAWESETETA